MTQEQHLNAADIAQGWLAQIEEALRTLSQARRTAGVALLNTALDKTHSSNRSISDEGTVQLEALAALLASSGSLEALRNFAHRFPDLAEVNVTDLLTGAVPTSVLGMLANPESMPADPEVTAGPVLEKILELPDWLKVQIEDKIDIRKDEFIAWLEGSQSELYFASPELVYVPLARLVEFIARSRSTINVMQMLEKKAEKLRLTIHRSGEIGAPGRSTMKCMVLSEALPLINYLLAKNGQT